MLVQNFLEESAQRTPDKVALIVKGERLTYSEINGMAAKVAAALRANGLAPGDRVALFLDNSLEAVAGLFGALKAGGVFVMVNPTTKAAKLSYILNNCRVSALLAPAHKAGLVNEVASVTPSLKAVYLAGSAASSSRPAGARLCYLNEIFKSSSPGQVLSSRIDADLANIVYTSGSTGNAKGVMMTHLNVVSAVNSITEYLGNTPEDIIMNMLPMSFDYGLYQVLMAFRFGGAVILENSFLYPYRIMETIVRENVTGFPIVPTISAILVQMEGVRKFSFDRLRYMTNTAAALPSAHIRELRQIFPRTRIFSMYGLTECKRVAYLPPEELDRRPLSVGKAMPNTEAYVVDESGKRVGPGVTGELVVRGSNVMRGYWEMPEETAKKLKPGETPGEMVLYTGDLFRTDSEGYLYFVARKDNVIKSRGEKVSPREIEEVLYSLEGVQEAVVFGTADPVLGQAINAHIVLKGGSTLSENEVLRHCCERLESFMVPQSVKFVKELAKTGSFKVKTPVNM